MVAERKDAASSTTHFKLAKFVPFTDRSLKKIADRIAAEEARDGDQAPQQQATTEQRLGGGTGKKVTTDDVRRKDKPNTAFVAGKQFPEKFGIFPPELYGKPIEDLDEFYSNKYVSRFSLR